MNAPEKMRNSEAADDREAAWTLLFESLADNYENLGFEDGSTCQYSDRQVEIELPQLWSSYEQFAVEFTNRVSSNINRLSAPLLAMMQGEVPLDAPLFERNSRAIRLYRWLASLTDPEKAVSDAPRFIERIARLREQNADSRQRKKLHVEALREQIQAIEKQICSLEEQIRAIDAADETYSRWDLPYLRLSELLEQPLSVARSLIFAKLWDADYSAMRELRAPAPADLQVMIEEIWAKIIESRSAPISPPP